MKKQESDRGKEQRKRIGKMEDRKRYVAIALLQLLPEADLEGQLKKGKEACIKAKAMGPILPCFRLSCGNQPGIAQGLPQE